MIREWCNPGRLEQDFTFAPKANWKRLCEDCRSHLPGGALYGCVHVRGFAFHTINQATGRPVRRQYVDSDTGKPVERDEQVKDYESGLGDHVVLEPEEVAAAVPTMMPALARLTCSP
jgi:DNA end-binding protein Ku